MVKEHYIGIDCGKYTGYAVWNVRMQKFDELLTTDFWGCIAKLQSLVGKSVTVVIENPNLIPNTFKRQRLQDGRWITVRGRRHDHISQSVGMNKRDSQLIIEFCQRNLLDYIESKPAAGKSKWSQQYFNTVTGYKGKPVSQHARDAGAIVFKIK